VRQAVIWASRTFHGNTELIVTPANATSSATTGKGEVNYAATWDEFSNGRFGEFPRSAAKTNEAALAVS
jgi:hypothetical protein